MPELPEVETTRAGVEPHIKGRLITDVIVRNASLRQPVPEDLGARLCGQRIRSVARRAKYLLMEVGEGILLVHLGMSGSLRMVVADTPPESHDHVDIAVEGGMVMRYRDPRRFGLVLWLKPPADVHPLLAHLGPEPLSADFTAAHLHGLSRRRKAAVKNFLMDGRVVVGVGNIYANEALYMAGIRPTRPAGQVSLARYQQLVEAVQTVLREAIAQGGTTLRDFVGSEGKPGYFSQQLQVYGRAGDACPGCGQALKELRLGQRSTVFCASCQR